MRRGRAALAAGVVLGAAACAGSPDAAFVGRRSELPIVARVSFMRNASLPVVPYDPFARHAGVLDDCIYFGRRTDPCSLLRLPILGLETASPSVDDVMGRVLVSHAWMGARFRELLETAPADLLLLFRPVTAVAISSDVRPSFYLTATGAIYLDPAGLWLTQQERDSVSTRPDFRSDFDAVLAFRMLWRYVRGSAPAYRTQPRPGALRSFEEVRVAMARLLYHELAHANDFLAPARLGSLSPYQGLDTAARPDVQRELAARLPLRSSLMRGLARVRFTGAPATLFQTTIGPGGVAAEFAADAANDFYNYTNDAEDTAMLFEELMTSIRFGAARDVAVTPPPAVPNPTGSDYIVHWGQRNRVGDANVRERVRLVARLLIPELSLDAEIDALPPPRQLEADRSWTANLALAASGVTLPMEPAERRFADDDELVFVHDCGTLEANRAPR
jgi:hypothetical protein